MVEVECLSNNTLKKAQSTLTPMHNTPLDESVAEWSRSRTHNSDVVGSHPGAAMRYLNCTS
jgi:hypothetical protein